MRHTAYGDYAVDVRVNYMLANGVILDTLKELNIGPVILKETNEYLREAVMGDVITIDLKLAGISSDGSSWILQHEIMKPNGKKSAILRIEGGWLDLQHRRLVAPPNTITDIWKNLEPAEGYTQLPSRVQNRYSRESSMDKSTEPD
jgi:acyl-CoA thioester hydrolase